VYNYEETSNECCKAKGKQKEVEPRKHARTDAYDTDDDLLSWQEGAPSSSAPSVGQPTISEFTTSVNVGGPMPQANPVAPDDGTMDIDRDEGLSMVQYPLLLPPGEPNQPASNGPAIPLHPSGEHNTAWPSIPHGAHHSIVDNTVQMGQDAANAQCNEGLGLVPPCSHMVTDD
jgi:hypothetical protein